MSCWTDEPRMDNWHTEEPRDAGIPVEFGLFHVACFFSAACLMTVGWLAQRCRR